MIKQVVFLKKRDDISMEDFIDYYENHHVDLCRNILPPLEVYRRNYVMNDDPLLKAIGDNRAVDGENDFDVITEAIYTTRAEAQASMNALFDQNVGPKIMADEAKFCEPGGIKFYVVQVRQSSIPW